MIIGLFIDVWNWIYTKNRIKLLKSNSVEIWQANKLRLSYLGVLYTVVEVDKTIPENLVGRFIHSRLKVVDDALVAINLDGLLTFKYQLYAESDITRYMLVKFVPNMPHWTWWYFGSSCVVGYVAVKLLLYFEVFKHIGEFLKPVIDVLY